MHAVVMKPSLLEFAGVAVKGMSVYLLPISVTSGIGSTSQGEVDPRTRARHRGQGKVPNTTHLPGGVFGGMERLEPCCQSMGGTGNKCRLISKVTRRITRRACRNPQGCDIQHHASNLCKG
jgi:hypothetical protein